ncbi:exodeoxyribonuclease III [Candidatus Kapabacteria bacterium]|nr:exodeoxyribonuclease III [Candidatus Kapabacteria bacterium]
MKIISWNINGYRAITGQNPKKKYGKIIKDDNVLFRYIEQENPDVICLQETKSDIEQIREDLKAPPGYNHYYHSCRRKKGYSGVVTFSKQKAESSKIDFSIERFDHEGRFIETDFGDFILMNIYFPNGTSSRERVDYKLDFYDALFSYIDSYLKDGRKVIVCGDYNTAHTEIDLARPKDNINTSGFLLEEREKLDEIFARGFVDSFRIFNKEPDNYTWWSQRGRARENNVGWRIDYHLVSENLAPDIKKSYHQPDSLGSDHCPIILEF